MRCWFVTSSVLGVFARMIFSFALMMMEQVKSSLDLEYLKSYSDPRAPFLLKGACSL